MNILGSSIKSIRLSKKMTQKRLSELTGFKQNTISNHENGKRQLDETDIHTYAKALEVSPQQLFDLSKTTTTSPQASDELVTAINDKVIHLDRELKEPRHSAWISHGERLLEEQKKEEQGTDVEETMELYSVLTTTSLAAGVGYAFNDYDQETVYVGNKPPRHDLASFISGDSMEPKYHNGDIVYLVDKGFSSYAGEICAVAVNDKTYLKRVYTEKGQLRLVSINPKYDDIYIDFPPTDGHIRIYSVVGTDSVVKN